MLPFRLASPAESAPELSLTIVECPPGEARRRRITERCGRDAAAPPSLLDCSMARRGLWAGVSQWIEQLVDPLLEREPELMSRHSYEILGVAPTLRHSLKPRYSSLTDLAADNERVRLFPRDRALRIPHGLIDLLIECVERGLAAPPLAVACDAFDQAGTMTRTFFAELVRRAGPVTGVRLVLGVDPGAGDEVLAAFRHGLEAAAVERLSFPAEPAPAPAVDSVRARVVAQLLEARVGDAVATEVLLPDLIQAWEAAGDDSRALHWRAEAFARYTFLGFYADAWEYGREIVAHLDEYAGADEARRYRMLNKVFGCLVGIGGDALPTLLEMLREGLGKLTQPSFRGGVHYMLAMLYARYLPEHDLERAEEHLELGLAELERSREVEVHRRFRISFNRNGLALIRFRQGRSEEAIALCRGARRELDEYLPAGKHRLHRSVLLFNIAQVYGSMGQVPEAIDHLSQAIEMDPEYSEYFNDRGMLLFRSGRLEEAKADFLRAIDLSPPYFEVWTNLGQCLRRAGDFEGAVEAYDRALDLEPGQPLALAGRGDCHQELGRLEAAYADYTAAIAQAPESWDCLGNRAVVLYGLGRVSDALADLDRAVALAPEAAELRQNRAVALADLGERGRAREDLERYLELAPDAQDRPEVEAKIAALVAA
jgi:tetratricopeptide (TPR) repeat protein